MRIFLFYWAGGKGGGGGGACQLKNFSAPTKTQGHQCPPSEKNTSYATARRTALRLRRQKAVQIKRSDKAAVKARLDQSRRDQGGDPGTKFLAPALIHF